MIVAIDIRGDEVGGDEAIACLEGEIDVPGEAAGADIVVAPGFGTDGVVAEDAAPGGLLVPAHRR